MKNYFLSSLFMACLVISCSEPAKENPVVAQEKTEIPKTEVALDTTPRVTGIGGIFIVSGKPGESKEWYAKNLGMAMDDYGGVFEFRNGNRPDEKNYLRWSLFPQNYEYMAPSKKDFMINYRVQNLAGLVRNLKNNGVQVLDSIATYNYGKFVHVMDNDGNKIELWEPVDSELEKLGGVTNK